MANEVDEFFRDAFLMIYDKLTSEEKAELDEELSGEEPVFEKPTPKHRFLSILRFVEVKYAMTAKWIEGISNSLATINKACKGENQLIDIVFADSSGKEMGFRELEKQGFRFRELATSLKQLLEQLGLVADYQSHLRSLGFTGEEKFQR